MDFQKGERIFSTGKTFLLTRTCKKVKLNFYSKRHFKLPITIHKNAKKEFI